MRKLATTSTSASALFRTAARNHHPHQKIDFSKPRILITGALGQVGSDLTEALRKKYGAGNVITTDIRAPESAAVYEDGPFEFLDVLKYDQLERAIVNNKINWVIHLSAIMSVLGEQKPDLAMDLNINGARNVLDVCRRHGCLCYTPSSMAVFGADAGKVMTKDDTILNPSTVYGITKVLLEQLGSYYHRKFGLDFRCLRYPGLISPQTLPGGGTTDYACHMYFDALKGKPSVCPVNSDEPLPMMYNDDAIRGTIEFIEAPRKSLTRCVYNLAGMSFTPDGLAKSIRRTVPGLEVKYERGIAQDIAHSWPDSMDDSNARRDWGWKPEYDLDKMTDAMLRDIPKFHPGIGKK